MEHLDWPDYVIFAILGLSVIIGLFRGFIREALGLVIWAGAFWVAFTFTDLLTPLLENGIELPSARTAIAFAMLFLAALIIGGLLSWLIGQMVEKTGLSGTDRMLGGVFGIVRGLALVILLLLLAGFTPIPKDPWFQQSPMIRKTLPLAEWAIGFLPASLAEHMDFNAKQTSPEPEAEMLKDLLPDFNESDPGNGADQGN